MKAVVVREFGAPGVMKVEEAADPVAGPGQVVVAVLGLWLAVVLGPGGTATFTAASTTVTGAGTAELLALVRKLNAALVADIERTAPSAPSAPMPRRRLWPWTAGARPPRPS